MTKVSFQGERGAYSEAAAISFFGKNIETVPLLTFAEVLVYTTKDNTDYSVLPIENSLEGSVGESYDLLYSTSLNTIGEIYQKIEHCLIGTGTMKQVDTVYSHPQALGQCRNFIQKHNIKTVPSYDTAGSVKIIKEMKKDNVTCIASKNASEIYQIPIIKEGIADKPNNYTRFLVLSKNQSKETKKDKTSIIFSIKHEPGTLFQILEKFNHYGVNLTKIESRPTKDTAWEYNFYVDFEGHISNQKISEMISKIQQNTLFFKILGSYPAAELD
ncbi:MAG: Prephenate dehydratase [Nitrosopumilales archaeon]|nr:MAG: Prephenate dehydratase [Nitrosopumilales archaeon]